jgi:hypothetical protein
MFGWQLRAMPCIDGSTVLRTDCGSAIVRSSPCSLTCDCFMRPSDSHARDEFTDPRFDARPSPDDPETRRGASLLDSRWLWLLFGMAGVVAFELGVHPAITAVLFCVKLGFPHLANGLWLWRNDPRSGRGLVLGFGYLALAGWRVVLWSFVLSAFLAYVSTMLEAFRKGNGAAGPAVVDKQVIGALGMVFGLMLVASSVLSALVCLAAGFLGTPLWLSQRVTEWRKADSYPPNPIGGSSTGSLLNFSLLVICIFLLTVFLASMLALGPVAVPGVFLGVIGIPVFTLVMRDWLGHRIVANSPAECWDIPVDFADDVNGDAESVAGDDDMVEEPFEIVDDDRPSRDWRRGRFGS